MVWLVIAYRAPWHTANCAIFLTKSAIERSSTANRIASIGSRASGPSISTLPRRPDSSTRLRSHISGSHIGPRPALLNPRRTFRGKQMPDIRRHFDLVAFYSTQRRRERGDKRREDQRSHDPNTTRRK